MANDDDVFVDNTPHIIADHDVDTDKGDINIEDNTALSKKKNKRKRASQKKGQNVGIQWKWLWTMMERKPINLDASIALKSLILIVSNEVEFDIRVVEERFELKRCFFEYEVKDTSFARDLNRVPQCTDFEVIEDVIMFLEKFKIKTKMLLASSKALVQTVLREIIDVDQHLETYSTKVHLCHMIPFMHTKYNKYRGSIENLNDFHKFCRIIGPLNEVHLFVGYHQEGDRKHENGGKHIVG
uniref:Uncharacterized protein n=1 Tax=Lactuca sativa TaxID=4236 RepID=A0A9R1W3U6_LACSA|nr:hypothetical protein LSAT_V11C300128000 [Lactuca sativa]